MKKTVASFIVLCALSVQVFGQNIHTVLSQLSKHENVEKITIGSFGMFFVKMAEGVADGQDALKGMKGIKSFELLTLSDMGSNQEKANLRNQLKNLKDDREYTTLMRIKDGDEQIRFLIKQEKETVKEIVMIILSDKEQKDNTVVIRLKGNFKESDLSAWVGKNNQTKDGQ